MLSNDLFDSLEVIRENDTQGQMKPQVKQIINLGMAFHAKGPKVKIGFGPSYSQKSGIS
ncbi:MAG: hypothetical protein LBF22_11055 [Deltaproteobacteria bacterium]|jgi:hypothetical protein|nr:hypothetical protein [Deltaproteobacteria bacterium]